MKTTVSAMVCAALFAACALHAADPVPPAVPPAVAPRIVPYKDIPDLLFYENFEHGTGSYLERGTLVSGDPAPPGGHIWKLEPGDDWSWVIMKLNLTPTRIPKGDSPSQIFIQASVYAADAGELEFKFKVGKDEYWRRMQVAKPKTWTVVMSRLADIRKDKKQVEPGRVFDEFFMFYHPQKGKSISDVWVDDVMITVNTPPDEIKPRLDFVEKKRLEVERLPERDGFAFSVATRDYLKNFLKSYKSHVKAKSAVVMGPTPELTQAWTKSLALAVPKLKESWTFHAADGPAESVMPVGGLADMRTLLPSSLAGDPEMALLIVSADDALGPGTPGDSVRVILDRTLATGAIPVVCIAAPSSPDQKDRLSAFVKSVAAICEKLNVPMVNLSVSPHGAKGEADPRAGTDPMDKGAFLIVSALKHIHDNLAKD